MSRLPSSKTAQIWAERIAQCEPSNVPTAQFCQSIGCSLTSFYQWKRKLASAKRLYCSTAVDWISTHDNAGWTKMFLCAESPTPTNLGVLSYAS